MTRILPTLPYFDPIIGPMNRTKARKITEKEKETNR